MSGPTVLIAGFSGRALAASARRAGFWPLVADAFGDADTRALAAALEVVPDAFAHGFHFTTLGPALERLVSAAPSPPVGLILAAGFEDNWGLVTRLGETHRLLGCRRSAVEAVKDPTRFFPLLASLGITHPQTLTNPPATGTGYLSKRVGGSGGSHIARCRTHVAAQRQRYYQREIAGVPISMLGLIGKTCAFAFTRSWSNPAPRRPYRFGGIAGAIDIEADLEARLISIGLDVARTCGLAGLVSFDFLVGDDTPYLLEVNPRAGASLDVLDDDEGTLFKAHLSACEGGDGASLLASDWQPRPRAMAYVYADRGPLTAPTELWPVWCTDLPLPGTPIAQFAPAMSAHATAATLAQAESILADRLGELEAMLYGRSKKI